MKISKLKVLTLIAMMLSASSLSLAAEEEKVWTEAMIVEAQNERIAKRIGLMIDFDKVKGDYKFIYNKIRAPTINKAVKGRYKWLKKDILLRVKKDAVYHVTQVLDDGFLMRVRYSYEGNPLPIMVISDRFVVEGDSLKDVTDLVQFKKVIRYETVMGIKKQAILLDDIWNGQSPLQITMEMNKE